MQNALSHRLTQLMLSANRFECSKEVSVCKYKYALTTAIDPNQAATHTEIICCFFLLYSCVEIENKNKNWHAYVSNNILVFVLFDAVLFWFHVWNVFLLFRFIILSGVSLSLFFSSSLLYWNVDRVVISFQNIRCDVMTNESSFSSCLSMEMKPKFENYTYTNDWVNANHYRQPNSNKQKISNNKHETKRLFRGTKWPHDLLLFIEWIKVINVFKKNAHTHNKKHLKPLNTANNGWGDFMFANSLNDVTSLFQAASQGCFHEIFTNLFIGCDEWRRRDTDKL